MLRAQGRVACVCRWGAFGLTLLLAAAAVSCNAEARSRRHSRAVAHPAYDPPYASIVVDANSGAVMQATSADSPRHPASLTKIMTLYLLFERMEAGKIKLTTEMPVSAHAAAQAPSKLGLKPGDTIAVESAIRGIVTKSANDVAVVIAEALGGSEDEFAKQMTAKARALGMTHTVFRDASGLPNDEQITTARDMAILGRAVQDRFPQYYAYFSTRSFAFRGRVIRGHNHLLGSIDGVDGIKTGYINASGFNIVTSVHRNNRAIIAVVFGGHTAEARDARVRSLIANNINIASAKRTAPPVVEGWAVVEARKEAAEKTAKTAAAVPLPTEARPVPGSTDPLRPTPVKTFAVQPGGAKTASLSPLPSGDRKLKPAPATSNPASIITVATVRGEPTMPGDIRAQAVEVASAGDSVPVPSPDIKPDKAAKAHGDWMIQVGAFDSQTEALERLTTVQNNAKDLLGEANPFTERVEKGDKALFRARFAGLEKSRAETICKNLKRSEIPCMLLRN